MPDEHEIPPVEPTTPPEVFIARPAVADGDWDNGSPAVPLETVTLDPPGGFRAPVLGNAFADLGQRLLDDLRAGLLGHVVDPEAQALLARATATLASVPLVLATAPDDAAKADLTNQFDAAMGVVLSLVSAQGEDLAAVRAKAAAHVREVVAGVVTVAVQAGFDALKVGLKLALV